MSLRGKKKHHISDFTSCPHCGQESHGYYIKVQYSGSYQWKKEFDGSDKDNSEVYDHLVEHGGTVAYCGLCDKRIGRNNL